MSYHDDDTNYDDPEIKEILKFKEPGFDHRVEVRHPRTGQMLKIQPYRCTVTQSSMGVIKVYERDGKKFWEDGSIALDEDLAKVLGSNHSLLSPVPAPVKPSKGRPQAA